MDDEEARKKRNKKIVDFFARNPLIPGGIAAKGFSETNEDLNKAIGIIEQRKRRKKDMENAR